MTNQLESDLEMRWPLTPPACRPAPSYVWVASTTTRGQGASRPA